MYSASTLHPLELNHLGKLRLLNVTPTPSGIMRQSTARGSLQELVRDRPLKTGEDPLTSSSLRASAKCWTESLSNLKTIFVHGSWLLRGPWLLQGQRWRYRFHTLELHDNEKKT